MDCKVEGRGLAQPRPSINISRVCRKGQTFTAVPLADTISIEPFAPITS